MFNRIFAATCLITLSVSANASDYGEEAPPPRLRPFIGAGFTWGGSTLEPATITPKGSTTKYQEDISAGAGLDFRVGVDYRLTEKISLQAAVAYHNDQATGTNGHIAFRRVPVELIGHWQPTNAWRFGLGARKGTRAVLDYDVKEDLSGNPTPTVQFGMKMSPGIIVEAERFVTPSWSIKFRYVKEKVWYEDFPDFKYKADHIGLITAYYFD